MNEELAVIGGVGFSLDGMADVVETIYGPVPVIHTRIKGQKVLFIPRHGTVHLPPHKVNYRGIISAAKKSGITRVISINTVGSMRIEPAGSLFFPTDFIEFTKCRSNTFFQDRAVHVDMSQPYCPELRRHLAKAAHTLGLPATEGVYVCAEGPHLESPAQIRMMSRLLVKLPKASVKRKALRRICQDLCAKRGGALLPDEKDMGESHLFINLE